MILPLRKRDPDPREYVDAYLEFCRRERKSPHTLESYGNTLQAWAATGDTPDEYIQACEAGGNAPSTLNRKRKIMVAFWDWLIANGLAEVNVGKLIPRAFEDEKEYRVLTVKEIVKLIDGCSELGKPFTPGTHRLPGLLSREAYIARTRAMIGMVVTTGLRLEEVCTIEHDRLDYDTRSFTILGKGRKFRPVTYGRAAARLLPAWLEVRPDLGNYLFNTHTGTHVDRREFQRQLAEASDWAGIGHVTPHMLRHTFATTAIDSGVSVYQVKEMLGHASIKTTERYIHADPAAAWSDIERSPLSDLR